MKARRYQSCKLPPYLWLLHHHAGTLIERIRSHSQGEEIRIVRTEVSHICHPLHDQPEIRPFNVAGKMPVIGIRQPLKIPALFQLLSQMEYRPKQIGKPLILFQQ